MGCGSADTEGGSPKASQAINYSFPPYSSINKQVAMENPGENVSYLHSGILFLLKFSLRNLTWATFEPTVYLQADMPTDHCSCNRLVFSLSLSFSIQVLHPVAAEHKGLNWFYILYEGDRVCVGGAHACTCSRTDRVCGSRRLARPEATTTPYWSSSPGYCCGVIISENAVSSSTSDHYRKEYEKTGTPTFGPLFRRITGQRLWRKKRLNFLMCNRWA